MLFSSLTQFVVLILLLVVGWLFGFASHPGGKKWRRAYEDEAVGRAQDRDELDGQLRQVDARIAELEQENTALARRNDELTAQVARVGVADRAVPPAAPVAAAEPEPAPAVPAAPAAPAAPMTFATPPVVAPPADRAVVPALSTAEPAPPPPVYLSRLAPDAQPAVAPVAESSGWQAGAPVIAAAAARPAFPRTQPVEPEPVRDADATRGGPEVPFPMQPMPERAAPVHEDTPRAEPGVPFPMQPAPLHADEPAAQPLPIKRGWFDWSRGDDLTRLRGIDAGLQDRLKGEKVETFSELANLSEQDEIALERRLDLPAGFIMREQIRDQARLLADGRADEHGARFG